MRRYLCVIAAGFGVVLLTGASPIADLLSRVEALESAVDSVVARLEAVEQALMPPTRQVLLDDDFEDGIDPAWVQVSGTTRTIAPTGDCEQAYFSKYPNCGSLGLHFDEAERYDYELPEPATGSFSLYFHDDPADTAAAAWIGVRLPGNQERLGVNTEACPNTYYVSLNPGDRFRCTTVPRRLGWHRVEFVRDGTITQGYLDYVLVFETNRPGRDAFSLLTVVQEVPWLLLDGFSIDDVQFVATD